MDAPLESPLKLYFSYSHRDQEFVERLTMHLKPLEYRHAIRIHYNKMIEPGERWESALSAALEASDIVLFLISADFLASEYVYKEIESALALQQSKGLRIIPVILRPCDWSGTPLSQFQALPPGARPITSWPDQDGAFLEVITGIQREIEKIKTERLKKPTPDVAFERPDLPKGYERLRLAYLAVLENPELYPFLESWDQSKYPSALDPSAFDRLHSKHADEEPPPLWSAWMQAVHPDKLGIEVTALDSPPPAPAAE
jgi:TIR domain